MLDLQSAALMKALCPICLLTKVKHIVCKISLYGRGTVQEVSVNVSLCTLFNTKV